MLTTALPQLECRHYTTGEFWGVAHSNDNQEVQWELANMLLEYSIVTEGRLPPPKQAVDRVLVDLDDVGAKWQELVQDLLWAAKLQADNRTRLFVMVKGCQPDELWWASAVNHLYAACRRLELQYAA